jgi:isocitrate dehydrogenase kinase/phosphatase
MPGNADNKQQLASACANEALAAFERYNGDFRDITRRAPLHFEQRDWQASQRDAVERIELYGQHVNLAVRTLSQRLGSHSDDKSLWEQIKKTFAAAIGDMSDAEFRKTFFNSLTRTFFGTIGVAPDIEFVAVDLNPLARVANHDFLSSYHNRGSIPMLLEEILTEFKCKTPWRDFERSIAQVAEEIEVGLALRNTQQRVLRIDVIRPVFFQITRAYIVGQIVSDSSVAPLVIALKNTERGLLIDAVMTHESDISILFSFTRSYFHVDLDYVGEVVRFLKNLMPRKPISELFTVIGRAKQGKTERYRELMYHLEEAKDQFVLAPGERGLVMVVFTLPSFDVVFKLIRDQFPIQKNIVREDVLAKYELVFKHDRAGRLVDAQEFKRLRFPKRLFEKTLLDELLSETQRSVHEDGDDLTIDHCYIERRMTPLNIYVREASVIDATRAVLDYGQAIRDLAYTNIFAGDLLLKNFGVTRHRRVIFYDYDELCLVTDCRFRDLPTARSDEDEMRADTWYYVGDNDVFPETFINFLGFDSELKAAFLETHGELLTAAWWCTIQERLRTNDVIEVLPYSARRVTVAGSL